MLSYVNYILFRGGQYTPRYSLGAAPQNACLFSPLSSSGTYSRIIQSLFCSFVILPLCSQINHFRACIVLLCSSVFYCAHLHQLALLRIQDKISVQGSFRTCWEWKRALKEEKKRNRRGNTPARS